MEFKVKVCRLSEMFYLSYPQEKFPEILRKAERPYTCLMIETDNGYLICIPFRSSIKHNDAFIFKNIKRSKNTRSGLDYKKTVIVKELKYIDIDEPAVVDNDEYSMMMKHIDSIAFEIENYISRYVNHVAGTKLLHPREFERHYKYSTLPYFNNLLGIN